MLPSHAYDSGSEAFRAMRPLFLSIPLIILGFSALSAPRPNFTGTWKIDEARSRIDAVPALKDTVVKIDQQESKIVLTTLNGDHQAYTFELPTDGTPQKGTIDNQPATASAEWNEDRLVITVTREAPGGPVTEIRSAKLSDTGKTMSTIYTLKDSSGEKRGYGFYVRQQ